MSTKKKTTKTSRKPTTKKASVHGDDLAFIRGRLSEISRRMATLNADIGTERQACNDKLQEILHAAGVFDQFKVVEETRDGNVAAMQAEQQQLQAEANELGSAKKFIKKRRTSPSSSVVSAALSKQSNGNNPDEVDPDLEDGEE